MRRFIFIAALAGCNPTFPDPPSLVKGARILAVRGEPAEVRPGTQASFRVLASADASGAGWTFCNTPKPLDENNIVSTECLGDGVQAIGSGVEVRAEVPLKACQAFGPDPPLQKPGDPPLRPRDPDVSGGYYQPVRVTVEDQVGFGLQRIRCNLASAGAEIAVEFAKRYVTNQNPTLLPLTLPAEVRSGEKITLTASWPADSVENYPVYDLSKLALVDHRESMRVSWFASDGKFVHDRTGRGEDEMQTDSENEWTAPSAPASVRLWVVLRDSRGGVDFSSYEIVVTP